MSFGIADLPSPLNWAELPTTGAATSAAASMILLEIFIVFTFSSVLSLRQSLQFVGQGMGSSSFRSITFCRGSNPSI